MNLLKIELLNSSILIFGCALFFCPDKRTLDTIFCSRENGHFTRQVDANKDTQVALAAKLGIVPSVLNSIITRGKTPKNVIQNVSVCVIKGRT
jgi:hypothetical protein